MKTSEFLTVVMIVLMIYLMFQNPFLAGMVVLFGGMTQIFRQVVNKERKLYKISLKTFLKVLNTKKRRLRVLFESEKKKLFDYLRKFPLGFQSIN